jgi:hypothetical protein
MTNDTSLESSYDKYRICKQLKKFAKNYVVKMFSKICPKKL